MTRRPCAKRRLPAYGRLLRKAPAWAPGLLNLQDLQVVPLLSNYFIHFINILNLVLMSSDRLPVALIGAHCWELAELEGQRLLIGPLMRRASFSDVHRRCLAWICGLTDVPSEASRMRLRRCDRAITRTWPSIRAFTCAFAVVPLCSGSVVRISKIQIAPIRIHL